MSVAVERTRAWVQEMVVGLGLCPFAAPVVSGKLLHYAEHAAAMDPLDFALHEAIALLQAAPTQRATTLVIYPSGQDDFETFLDLCAQLEGALSAAGADGVLQVATFHPNYVFAGADPDDPANGTNRSPYPTAHLLREADISNAVASHPDPGAIPARNMDLLRRLAANGAR